MGSWPGMVNSSNTYLHEWIDPVHVIAYAGIHIRKSPWTIRLRNDEASKTTKHPVTISFADQRTAAVPGTSTGIFAYHAHDFILINTEVLLHGNPYMPGLGTSLATRSAHWVWFITSTRSCFRRGGVVKYSLPGWLESAYKKRLTKYK